MQRWHRIVITVIATVGSGWAFWSYHNRGHKFFDLKIYRSATDWWSAGSELYVWAQPDFLQGHLYFTYPPFAAALLTVFSHIPLLLAEILFAAGTITAVAVTTVWLLRALKLPGWLAAPAIPMTLALEPMRETITLGQINLALVILILADLLILGPKGSRFTGVGIGLATAIKLTPAIFILYLLLCRRWQAACTALAAAAGVTAVMFVVAPQASWQFWSSALWKTERVGRTDLTGNQSMLGMLNRLAIPAEPDRALWVVAAAGFAAFGLWRAVRAHRVGNEVAAIALTGLCGVIICPISWVHHLYWLVPALLAVLAGAWERRSRWLWLLFGAAYAAALIGVISSIEWDYGVAPEATSSLSEFIGRNLLLLVSFTLLAWVPLRPRSDPPELRAPAAPQPAGAASR